MGNFANCFLVKLCPDGPFISISTYDIYHGKSHPFLLSKIKLEQVLSYLNSPVIDMDLNSYLYLSLKKSTVRFTLTLLRQHYRNDVEGYIQSFELSVDQVHTLLNGQKIHHVEYTDTCQGKAELVFSSSGHQKLRQYCQDKLSRHALRRFFRDNFNYGKSEKLTIFPDNWLMGFYFQSSSGLDGGIVRHETVIKGKDGKQYPKITYAVHT